MKKKNLNKHHTPPKNVGEISRIFKIKYLKCLCSLFLVGGFILLHSSNSNAPKVSAEDSIDEIEDALYTRQEFFGAEAVVPRPTAEARDRLAALAANQLDNPEILEKYAGLNEKLAAFGEAEKSLIHLSEIDEAKLENLAAFYHRRAQFEREAETLRKILFSTDAARRAAVFGRLIDVARKHDLKNYLGADFFAAVAQENPDVDTVYEKLVEHLTEEKNYTEALNYARQARRRFPKRDDFWLEKEIDLTLAMNRPQEAEAVYQAAFDPFWSETEARKFYDFLNSQDRLRAYGAEVKARFKKNPADFDAAIRLALYRNHDYFGGNDEISPVILKLERAKKTWTTEELVTATRLLLQAGEADLAARFLYTLYARDDFQKKPELRAKVTYQLFEMFSDAGNRKLPLTKGDLRFYEDIAQADTNPGIATGILSLVFSDTNPRRHLENQEAKAMTYFNRAAAYRIFEEYKREFPAEPELCQMYLDVVRLYTATEETEIAEKTLDEFARKYENSKDYAGAALKLADAFNAADNDEKAREVYRKTLDYVGLNQQIKRQPPNQINFSNNSPPQNSEIAADRNEGISIPASNEKQKTDFDDEYDNESEVVFRDYLARKTSEITYEEVLSELVASLAKDKQTTEILALYSDEISKYPNEEWLYEQRLTWLEKTNLSDEQLQIYKTALARFQTRSWQDKLARFFLRQKRTDEFAAFSQDLVGKLKDGEVENYLSQFVDGKISADDFEKQLYLKLYLAAHRRFPHNVSFVNGLLRFYKSNKLENEWRKLAAEHYFEQREVREQFLDRLAETGELRKYLAEANGENAVYELFRADAAVRLSDYENAVAAYRKLNQIYPNTTEFSARLTNFTRSFGQKNREFLTEAANLAETEADFSPVSFEARTASGEIYAELGNYEKTGAEWEKLIAAGAGDKETYLAAATVYWDYFQYDDALRTLVKMREKFADETLYAFETGAILEAQHRPKEAIAEYVKALGATDSDDSQKEKAKKRLVFLAAKYAKAADEKTTIKIGTNNKSLTKEEFEKTVDAAFTNERARRKHTSFLSLGYAEFLTKIKQTGKAESVLNRAVRQNKDREFLEAAKDFYQIEENKTGEQTVLKRLAETSVSPRQIIAYCLQLAESFEEKRDRAAAKNVLDELARKYPLNYGVLTEASDFYKRLGFENESGAILQSALPKSAGAYQTALARKLAGRLINLKQLDDAARILNELHEADKTNTEIFGELARVCVARRDASNLRKSFSETVAALKQTDADRRELDEQIADLRIKMIDAFTRLADYQSAIEQHIEIINREPENEQLTDDAIRYVQRYGGAENLINYYQKTATEAFKNYRWNVVLARIYEAHSDLENAVKNYQAAIVNQPEMSELYLAITRLETKRNRFDEALKNLDTVLELTNDAPEYVKQKIEILKKAGRFAEAETERAKLPVEEKKIVVDRFAEARNLAETEREKSREIYREAFAQLLANPLVGNLKTADIVGYVQTTRGESDTLDEINKRLWQLRGNLIEIADRSNSTDAGEARQRLLVLDGALIESIGTIAKTIGTDEELAALHKGLLQKIKENSNRADRHQIVSLVQDLSRRAGFGDLEEKILHENIGAAVSADERQIHLRNLVVFYNERGAFQKTFDALEKYASDNLPLKAQTARLIGNREKEMEFLRAIYQKTSDKTNLPPDENVARYLEILHRENRDELQAIAQTSSVYQLQLINFLLGKGEDELAHSAIENSNFAEAWKASRNAETSFALNEYDDSAANYFSEALQFDSIGNLVRQKTDKNRFLLNNDWFRLTREYGEWLGEKNKSQTREDLRAEADGYLAAMIENQPRNPEEQFKLGEFYLEKNNAEKSIEHFRLALEINPEDKQVWASLGAAYDKIGRSDYAEASWAKVLSDGEIGSCLIYFQTLHKYGLNRKASEKLQPLIIEFLQKSDADDSADFQKLVRMIAASFDNDAEKSACFLQITEKRPTDTSLAAMLVAENLISENEQPKFYELLINRSDSLSDYDYKFASVRQRTWTDADAESVYEQENDYEIEEPKNEQCKWRKKYLELLVKRGEKSRAEQLAADIEKELKGRYARPAWLRIAEFRLQIRDGRLNETETERFAGITIADSTTEVKTPSVERFNDVLQILSEEKRESEAAQFSETYYARRLALGQFDAASFLGLARALFRRGEAEKALRVLQLMVDAGDEAKRETAFGEIAALDAVKTRTADAAKTPETVATGVSVQTDALRFAAEIAAEFGRNDSAIAFRRQLAETNPGDGANRFELAKLLFNAGDESGASNLLTDIINNRNTLRSVRWQARMFTREIGGDIEIPNASFDAFSQFYQGVFAAKNGQAEAADFYINSLIADKDAENSARHELFKLYTLLDKPYAALKIAETDQFAKSDETLEMLSGAAEKVGDYAKAIEYERAKSNGGNIERTNLLQKLFDEANRRATNLTVDAENTRKL